MEYCICAERMLNQVSGFSLLFTILAGFHYQEFGVMMEDAYMIESKNNSTLADMETMTNKVLIWCGKY